MMLMILSMNHYSYEYGHEKEYGYVSLDELFEFKGQFGLGIERDKFFKPKSLEECMSL